MRRRGEPRTLVPLQRVGYWPEHEVQRARAGGAEALWRLHGVCIGAGRFIDFDAIEGQAGLDCDRLDVGSRSPLMLGL